MVEPLIERLNALYENSPRVPVTQPEIGSFWVTKEPGKNIWSRVEVIRYATEEGTDEVNLVKAG